MALRVTINISHGVPATPQATRNLRAQLKRAVRAALEAHSVRSAEVSITLLDDAAISDMNHQYLAHAGPTDVISFALHEAGDPPLGDVYIGYEQATRQAASLHVALDEELMRLAIHGVLHVLGYDHPEGDEREESEMWALQERILAEVAARE
jgi:probable rRNA maturation factor